MILPLVSSGACYHPSAIGLCAETHLYILSVDIHKVLESVCISVHPATVLSVDSLDTEVGQLFHFSKSSGNFLETK